METEVVSASRGLGRAQNYQGNPFSSKCVKIFKKSFHSTQAPARRATSAQRERALSV